MRIAILMAILALCIGCSVADDNELSLCDSELPISNSVECWDFIDNKPSIYGEYRKEHDVFSSGEGQTEDKTSREAKPEDEAK